MIHCPLTLADELCIAEFVFQLEAKTREYNELLAQMRVVTKEKGVAMREHYTLFTELQDLRTQVCDREGCAGVTVCEGGREWCPVSVLWQSCPWQAMELQTEKDLMANEREINAQLVDQLRAEQVTLKRKLETIKHQRSADARELSNMRTERDNTAETLESTRKTLEDVAALRDTAEQALHQVGTGPHQVVCGAVVHSSVVQCASTVHKTTPTSTASAALGLLCSHPTMVCPLHVPLIPPVLLCIPLPGAVGPVPVLLASRGPEGHLQS